MKKAILLLKGINCHHCDSVYSPGRYFNEEEQVVKQVVKCGRDERWLKEPSKTVCENYAKV